MPETNHRLTLMTFIRQASAGLTCFERAYLELARTHPENYPVVMMENGESTWLELFKIFYKTREIHTETVRLAMIQTQLDEQQAHLKQHDDDLEKTFHRWACDKCGHLPE
jgi:hypothetical protein